MIISTSATKIVFIGPQGTGKSTAARKLAYDLMFPLIEEVARSVAKTWKIENDDPDIPAIYRAIFQLGIIQTQLSEEMKFPGGFISDRSTIDNTAYLYILLEKYPGILAENLVQAYVHRCWENAMNYDHIFYMPATISGLINDQFRNLDPDYQQLVDERIRETIEVWGLRDRVSWVPSEIDWQEKYVWISNHIA